MSMISLERNDGKVVEDASADVVRETVRDYYGARVRSASSCCGPDCCQSESNGAAALYSSDELALVPAESASVAYGCGNPTALAALKPGEVVVDLGSGGGIDCFLAAQRVGPSGFVYGIDMTDEMLALARRNAERQGFANVEFRKGVIEALPLEDSSVDVIISNCVVNLSPDKPAAMREAMRVLRPGGRIAISDVLMDGTLDGLPVTEAQVRRTLSWAGCVAGALPVQEMKQILTDVGFVEIDVELQGQKSLNEQVRTAAAAEGLPENVIEQLAQRFVNASIRAHRPA